MVFMAHHRLAVIELQEVPTARPGMMRDSGSVMLR